MVKVCIPMEVIALIGWWFWVVIRADSGGWWNPLKVESVGTCLFQWGLVLLILVWLNRWMAHRTLEEA